MTKRSPRSDGQAEQPVWMGDKCWVQGKWKMHYGVCVGHDSRGEPLFVHNTQAGGVVLSDRLGFAGRRTINIASRAGPGQALVVAERARSFVGKKYDLLFFNCEHVANLATTGRAESPQVQQGVGWSILGLLALAAINNNGTQVDQRGYRRDANGRFAARRWW